MDTTKYKPYPTYKDSGVEWLGDVPENWEAISLKRVLLESLMYGANEASDDDTPDNPRFVRITDINSDGSLREDTFRSLPLSVAEPYLLKEGDVLLARSGATVGKSFIYKDSWGICCFAGYLIRARLNLNLMKPFYLYACCQSSFYWQYINSEQIQATIQNVSAERYGNFILPLPPIEEQTAIAAFLDRETAKIDTLLKKQERLIELLQEKRTALISHAVTKGLNPDAPMKDSGVPWLGEVPEHWKILPLARITSSRCDGPFGSGLKSEHYTDEGARVIRLQNIRKGLFDDSDSAYIDLKYFQQDLLLHEVRRGDLLIAGLGDTNNTVGRACVAPLGIEPALVKADCFRFRLKTNQAESEFVALQLTAGAEATAGYLATGSTRSRIPLSVMSSRKIVLPPINEQKATLQYIWQLQDKIDTLIAKARRTIDLLKERRTALISAAVTGKIDVRDAA